MKGTMKLHIDSDKTPDEALKSLNLLAIPEVKHVDLTRSNILNIGLEIPNSGGDVIGCLERINRKFKQAGIEAVLVSINI